MAWRHNRYEKECFQRRELFNQLQSVVDQTQRSYQDFVGLANGAKDSELGRKLHTLLDANARQARDLRQLAGEVHDHAGEAQAAALGGAPRAEAGAPGVRGGPLRAVAGGLAG